MWVFCKNECVKQKKQVLEVQNGKNFTPTDVIALNRANTFIEIYISIYYSFINTQESTTFWALEFFIVLEFYKFEFFEKTNFKFARKFFHGTRVHGTLITMENLSSSNSSIQKVVNLYIFRKQQQVDIYFGKQCYCAILAQ